LINWTPVQNSFFPSDGFNAGTNRIKYLNGSYYSVGSAAANGSNVNPILKSTDGINFVAPMSAPTFTTIDGVMINIVYGTPNGIPTYVAVGKGAFNGIVWYSINGGLTWQASSTSATGGFFFPNGLANLFGLANIAYGNGVFVIVGSGAESGPTYRNGFYYSTDGITFLYQDTNAFVNRTPYPPGPIGVGRAIAFDGTKFVALGTDLTNTWRWSTDGSNWNTSGFTGDVTWPDVTGGTEIQYNGSMWLAAGGYISASYGPLKYSYDGFSWTNVPNTGLQPNATFDTLSWDGVRWYAGIGGGVYDYASSYDGFTWTYGIAPNINNGITLLSQPSFTANLINLNALNVSSVNATSLTAGSIATNSVLTNSINAPLFGYSTLGANGRLYSSNSDSGRTFLLDVANGNTATFFLPSTSLITSGWNCKAINMNATGGAGGGNLYISSPQASALLYSQSSGGRASVPFINVTTGSITNYNFYAVILYDGSNFYGIH
jgi:hypothetical protein